MANTTQPPTWMPSSPNPPTDVELAELKAEYLRTRKALQDKANAGERFVREDLAHMQARARFEVGQRRWEVGR